MSGYLTQKQRSESVGSNINGLMLDWMLAMAIDRLISVESTPVFRTAENINHIIQTIKYI